MSVEAISLALSAQVDRSSAKFVLVAMANLANSDMTCWPSMQYLSDATSQDRKTVLENIKRLKDAGLLEDTGKRAGATGQIIVYQLFFGVANSPKNGTVKQSQKRNSPENGTVPKTEANSPVFPVKQSRFSRERGPKTGYVHEREPLKEPSGTVVVGTTKKSAFDAKVFLVEVGVDPQVADDWLSLRKSKKAPATKTAIDAVISEAKKAGIETSAALVICCQQGWVGFKSEWDSVRKMSGKPSLFAPVSRPSNGRQAAVDNYAAQAAAARGESYERTASYERDISGEAIRVA